MVPVRLKLVQILNWCNFQIGIGSCINLVCIGIELAILRNYDSTFNFLKILHLTTIIFGIIMLNLCKNGEFEVFKKRDRRLKLLFIN